MLKRFRLLLKNRRKWFYLLPEPTVPSAVLSHIRHDLTGHTSSADNVVPSNRSGSQCQEGLSAKQLQRDLGIGGYKTAWYLYHRIRRGNGRGVQYRSLAERLRFDETYVGGRKRGIGIKAAMKTTADRDRAVETWRAS